MRFSSSLLFPIQRLAACSFHHVCKQLDGGGIHDKQTAFHAFCPAAVRETFVVVPVQTVIDIGKKLLASFPVGIRQRASARSVFQASMPQLIAASLKPGADFAQRCAFKKTAVKHAHQVVITLKSFVVTVPLMLPDTGLNQFHGNQLEQLGEQRLSEKKSIIVHVI